MMMQLFALMQEIRVIHGIFDADVFSFDKTGFAIGVITSSMAVNSTDVISQLEYLEGELSVTWRAFQDRLPMLRASIQS